MAHCSSLRPDIAPFWSVQDNATDIIQAVEWLHLHDKEALRIAEAGHKFAVEHLSKEARLCFWKTLIEEWAKLFRCGAKSGRRHCILTTW